MGCICGKPAGAEKLDDSGESEVANPIAGSAAAPAGAAPAGAAGAADAAAKAPKSPKRGGKNARRKLRDAKRDPEAATPLTASTDSPASVVSAGSAADDTRKQCAKCQAFESTAKFLRCSRCKAAWYCSKEHQRAHWKKHKRHCKAPES